MHDDYNDFIKETDLNLSRFDMVKEEAYIQKVGNDWCVISEQGKKLGCYSTKPEAEKRLKQIDYWKHKKGYREESSYYCYCPNDGTYFYTPKRCDLSLCPVCKDPDRDNIEIIGEF